MQFLMGYPNPTSDLGCLFILVLFFAKTSKKCLLVISIFPVAQLATDLQPEPDRSVENRFVKNSFLYRIQFTPSQTDEPLLRNVTKIKTSLSDRLKDSTVTFQTTNYPSAIGTGKSRIRRMSVRVVVSRILSEVIKMNFGLMDGSEAALSKDENCSSLATNFRKIFILKFCLFRSAKTTVMRMNILKKRKLWFEGNRERDQEKVHFLVQVLHHTSTVIQLSNQYE